MDQKGSKQVDVLDVDLLPLPVSRSLRPFSNGSWDSTTRCLPHPFHQSKFRSKSPSGVVEHQTPPARVAYVFRKRRREVSQSVAPQRVRPQVESYRQQCRTPSVKSPGRAYLNLDCRITEKRRSNKLLDTFEKEYRRPSTARTRPFGGGKER